MSSKIRGIFNYLFKNKFYQELLHRSLIVVLCVLIIVLGIFLARLFPSSANPAWGNVSRSATVIVAASDSSATSKAHADYVANGMDDQAVIQTAINSLPNISTGTGQVVLLEGDFYITAPIEVRNSLLISGQGPRSTNLWQRANGNIFQYTGGTNVYFVTIQNLGLWGDKKYTSGRGIDFTSNVLDSLIFNVWVDGFKQENIYTCKWNCKIIATKSEHSGSYGIAGGTDIIDVHSIYNEYGIMVGTESRVVNGFFFRNMKTGVIISSKGGTSVVNSFIEDNNEDYSDPWQPEVAIYSGSNGVIFSNNYVSANSYLQPGVQNTYYALQDAGTKSIITQNYFTGFKSAGKAINYTGTGAIIRNNNGYTTENSGSATITAGQTSINVVHGLAVVPIRVQLTPTTDTGGKRYWISAKGNTTFTITINSPNISDVSFDWEAVAE